MAIPGIDISNWQGRITWSAVAADGIARGYVT
jgi:GH25 family lysozyme M1 (1,4-beta-N-acetylmuramidase)